MAKAKNHALQLAFSPRLVQLGKKLLPPIIVELLKRAIQEREWEYASAVWCVNEVNSRGWNHESVLETQRQKWPYFLAAVEGSRVLAVAHEAPLPYVDSYAAHNIIMSYGYALGLAARCKSRMSILDWGGGIGHYYVLTRCLLQDVDIEYHCKDVQALCQGGRELLPDVSFHDTDAECFGRTYDFVFSSASLQYVKHWKTTLQRLALATQDYLYVTRIPIVNVSPSFVVTQRPERFGYATEYIGWYINRQELLSVITRLKMKLVREFLMHEPVYTRRAPEQATYRGFLFRRQR